MNVQGKKLRTVQRRIDFQSIDSTNSWAKIHPELWSSDGITLVTASEQSAGRGRFKRSWISPPDVNIYATFCFWISLLWNDVGHIPQLMALAASLTLEEKGYSPKIKWPNDLLINGKKTGGILCETITEGDAKGVICGIGLNVNMTQKEMQKIDRPATSLFVEKGHVENKEGILKSMTDHFLQMLEKFLQCGFESFFPLLKERSFFIKGDPVEFQEGKTLHKAQFEALHPHGGVILRFADDTEKVFNSGEFINF